MRVALITEDLNPRRGGAERSASELAAELCRQRVELTVLARRVTVKIEDREYRDKIFRVSARTRSGRWRQFARAVAGHLAETNYNIVHSLAPIPQANVYQPRGGSILYSAKRSAHTYDSSVTSRIKLQTMIFNRSRQIRIAGERKLCEANSGPTILALSRYVQRQFQEEYQVPESRLRVIRNGINIDPIRCEPAREQGRRLRERFDPDGELALFLFAAENFRLKGLAPLIAAAARLNESLKSKRDFLILVAGGQEYSRYYQKVQKLGLGGKVVFLGSTRRMAALLHLCDAVVLPTFNDACSRLVMESLAAGKPAITTRYNGAADFLEDGKYGIIIDEPTNIQALALALAQLCDPQQQQRYCQAIEADRVYEQVSIQRHVQELIAAYKEIAAKKGK
jgi:UDP-glucose:(heptosyl)LPS alpha-1,3-glucosyltransferase